MATRLAAVNRDVHKKILLQELNRVVDDLIEYFEDTSFNEDEKNNMLALCMMKTNELSKYMERFAE